MFGTHDLALFVISGLLLNIAPGPDTFLIIGRSTSQGWRAGVAAALGIGAGTFVHIFAAAFGLSAILATSAAAFTVVKIIGAVYLFCLGVSLLRSPKARSTTNESTAGAALPLRKIFMQGFLTNVLNPKVALFFLAFVPQFIAQDAASKPLAFLFLGTLFNFNGMLWANFLAVSAAALSKRIKPNAALTTWFNRAIGGVFIGLGFKLALSEQN
jgi:threonine/homoserine/homoserine lactone efflux protein